MSLLDTSNLFIEYPVLIPFVIRYMLFTPSKSIAYSMQRVDVEVVLLII